MDDQENWWAGEITHTGAIVVYDPSAQISSSGNLYIFSVNRKVMRQFDRDELRAIVKSIYGQERVQAFSIYSEWKKENFERFLQTEPLRIIEESRRLKAEEDKLKENYRNKLIELGFDPDEFIAQKVTPRRHRVTHCYSCKRGLDNKLFFECNACHWIICTCGACGCGYSR